MTNNLLKESIEINEKKMGGNPVLKGTRFPIYQIMDELYEGENINDICDDYDLDLDIVKYLIGGLAMYFRTNKEN